VTTHKRLKKSGAKLWCDAKKIIPGGNQFLSKRPEMFLPEGWPSYFVKAKGANVWDLDDNQYIDMSLMGVGSCVLGYANPTVTNAVVEAIRHGSMSTLNCPEEVLLAKKLIDLHPWADMVRFCRTGGEACAIAVRIARAASGKDNVAFCGYHGWHDWYLAANLSDGQNLDGQLLPGLDPIGVPRVLEGTSLPFGYGDIAAFDAIIDHNRDSLGVVVMEVQRGNPIDLKFLNHIRKKTKALGIVLVYDEISSGFRKSIGGLHLNYELKPDMTILGKALGNGHPISAILGIREVMDVAQKSFISSTYWSERVGLVAALTTIKIYEEDNVVGFVEATGEKLMKSIHSMAEGHELNILPKGLSPMFSLDINEENAVLIKSLITQEMLKRGFLASTVIFVSMAHTEEIVDSYLSAMDEVLGLISKGLAENNLESYLEGPLCHTGFFRLT